MVIKSVANNVVKNVVKIVGNFVVKIIVKNVAAMEKSPWTPIMLK